MPAAESQDFRQRMARIEGLVSGVDHYGDAEARVQTKEIVHSMLELHAVGLERILTRLADEGDAGMRLIDALAEDELIGSLLLLYGLHPLDLETRVGQALERVRPYLRSHNGNVQLLGIDGSTVRLRMEGSCHGCPSSAVTLQQTIEQAIYEKAPDVTNIEVVQEEEKPATTFVPVEQLTCLRFADLPAEELIKGGHHA